MKKLILIAALLLTTGFSMPPDTYQIMLRVVYPFEREDDSKMVAGEYGVLHIFLNGAEIPSSPFEVKATSVTYQQVFYVATTEKNNIITFKVTDSDGVISVMSKDFIHNF